MAASHQPVDNLKKELEDLNREWADENGGPLKAGHCYHLETDPPHLLYNLNCPEPLREKLQGILEKYFPQP